MWSIKFPGLVKLSVLFFPKCLECASLKTSEKHIENFSGSIKYNTNKAELPEEGILFCTQFPFLGIFVNRKVGFQKY